MKFESVLFSAAFAALALGSLPTSDDERRESGETETPLIADKAGAQTHTPPIQMAQSNVFMAQAIPPR